VLIQEVTKDELDSKMVALIPIGSLEQHGPHLPLGTDSIIVEHIAKEIEKELREKVVLFPTIWFTSSGEHEGFPYFGVRPLTLYNYLNDLLESLVKQGFSKIVILNGHGGNTNILLLLQREFNFNHKEKVYVLETWGKEEYDVFKRIDLHAGSIETSRIFYINEALVRREKIREIDDYTVKEGIFLTRKVIEANKWGVLDLGGGIEINKDLGEYSIKMRVSKIKDELQRIISSS